MSWNEVLANVRHRLRHTLGRSDEPEVEGRPPPRLEQLGNVPIARPALDVYENESEVLIRADVPGGAREGTTVGWDEARGLTLQVKGAPLPSGRVWAREYQPCDWYGSVDLPDYVDGTQATSTLKDGVLTIRIPKRAADSKRIAVKAG